MSDTGSAATSFVLVPLTSIAITPERRAQVQEPVVEQLTTSIMRRGLLCPIRLRRDNTLVCGLHRCITFERLHRVEIPALYCDGSDVDVELDEIEENLARKELSVLERARLEHRQRELYLRVHADTAPGVAGGLARHGLQANTRSFADAQARRGNGVRLIQQRVQIAEALGSDADRLREHDIANNRTQLLELARLPASVRPMAVDLLATGHAKNVRDVISQIRTRQPAAPSPISRSRGPISCPVVLASDGYIAGAEIGGRRLRVCLATSLDICTVEDLGRVTAPKPTSRQETRALTFANSLSIPDDVIAELPSDLATDVRLSPIYIDDHCRCEHCGSTSILGDVSYICAQCTPDLERVAYGFRDEPLRNIASPRVLREITFAGSRFRPWHRHTVMWWYGPDRVQNAPVGSIYIEHWSSSLERWHLLIESSGSLPVETLKNQLREAILKQLTDRGHARRVRDRYIRQDGSEVAMVPCDPATSLPPIVRRTGLVPFKELRQHNKVIHRHLKRIVRERLQ